MDISVLGAGTMGRAMAALLTGSGHRVVLGSRSASPAPSGQLDSSLGEALPVVSYADAVRATELVVLATTWDRAEATVRAAGDFGNRVLLDCTNPETEDGRSLAVGHSTSGAELIAGWAPTARVVKAFNHVYAEVVAAPVDLRRNVSVFVCGDDGDARAAVAHLATEGGFQATEVGPLATARWLEPLAMLVVHLVRVQGLTPHEATLRLAGRRREPAYAPARQESD
jgi:predicted dinucleotide-binding enzyme